MVIPHSWVPRITHLNWSAVLWKEGQQCLAQLRNTSSADELPESAQGSVIVVVGFCPVISSRKGPEENSEGYFINRGTM